MASAPPLHVLVVAGRGNMLAVWLHLYWHLTPRFHFRGAGGFICFLFIIVSPPVLAQLPCHCPIHVLWPQHTDGGGYWACCCCLEAALFCGLPGAWGQGDWHLDAIDSEGGSELLCSLQMLLALVHQVCCPESFLCSACKRWVLHENGLGSNRHLKYHLQKSMWNECRLWSLQTHWTDSAFGPCMFRVYSGGSAPGGCCLVSSLCFSFSSSVVPLYGNTEEMTSKILSEGNFQAGRLSLSSQSSTRSVLSSG